jgi:hypothetical protein
VAQDKLDVNVGGMLISNQFLGKNYFWKGIPNFGACATTGKKETCRKIRKATCKRKIHVPRR